MGFYPGEFYFPVGFFKSDCRLPNFLYEGVVIVYVLEGLKCCCALLWYQGNIKVNRVIYSFINAGQSKIYFNFTIKY